MVPVISLVWFGVGGVGIISASLWYAHKNYKYSKKKRLYKTYMHSDLNGNRLDFVDQRVSIRDLRPGHHISVRMTLSQNSEVVSGSGLASSLPGFGYHHGVYLGKVRGQPDMVVDFGRANEQFPVIQSLSEFMRGRNCPQIWRRNYTRGFIFPFEEILATAIAMEGKNDWGVYDEFDNNCEHFATYLETGRVWSKQSYKFY